MYFEVLTIPIREFMFFVDHCFFDTLYERVSILNMNIKIHIFNTYIMYSYTVWLVESCILCIIYSKSIFYISIIVPVLDGSLSF